MYFINQKLYIGLFYFLWAFPLSLSPQVIAQASLATANYLLALGKTGSDCQSKSSLGQNNSQVYLPNITPSAYLCINTSHHPSCLGTLKIFHCVELFDPSIPLEVKLLAC